MGSYKNHLLKDPVLSPIVEKFGELQEIHISKNIFADLVDSIIGQQLSVKAASTITQRFKNIFDDSFPTPEILFKTDTELIRGAGISYSKISYIKGIAEAIVEGSFVPNMLYTMKDSDAIDELIKLKGVGRWTAEMVLIFSLSRNDIFSLGDLGLRTAVSRLYPVERDNLVEIEKISLKWSPYRSAASRYLWKSLDNE